MFISPRMQDELKLQIGKEPEHKEMVNESVCITELSLSPVSPVNSTA